METDELHDHTYFDSSENVVLFEHMVDHTYCKQSIVNNDISSNKEPVEDHEAENAQINRTYRCIPGVQDKSQVYIDNLHYKYYKKRVFRNKMYLICEKQRKKTQEYCPATAVIELNDPENNIRIQRGGHNHVAVQQVMDMPIPRRPKIRKRAVLSGIVNNDISSNQNPVEDHEAENAQINRTYRCIPGVQNKSQVYIDNLHYKYYKKSVVRNKMYLVCEKQRKKKAQEFCPATAVIELNDPENNIRIQQGGHNHAAIHQDMDMPLQRKSEGWRAI